MEVYTGNIVYKNIDFIYTFDGKELRLIPPNEKKNEVDKWFRKEISKGVYTIGEPIYIEEDYLQGSCNESGYGFIFLINKGISVGRYNSVLNIPIIGYIKKKLGSSLIDRISFKSNELNYIYSARKAFIKKYKVDDGTIELTTKNLKDVCSDKVEFEVESRKVFIQFGVTVTASSKTQSTPLMFNTTMNFNFEATDDYIFIYNLYCMAKNFIRFLCYRNNVKFENISLAAPYKDNSHIHCADLYLINDNKELCDLEDVYSKRYIKQEYINGKEGAILNDIACDKLYLRHLPKSYEEGRHIDASRFVMITAAFEWEFKRMYPDGIVKSAATIKAEKEAEKAITRLRDQSSGKRIKRLYKFLLRLIPQSSLQSEIKQIGVDFDNIVGDFGRYLYQLNNENLDYSKMGERIASQRNAFAHGNLEKEFIGLSLLDLIYLEYIIYAMQLKLYGISDNDIKRIINDLFNLHFVFKDEDE